MVDREDNEVFGLEGMHIGLVGDSKGASLDIIFSGGVNRGRRRSGAREVVAEANVATVPLIINRRDPAQVRSAYSGSPFRGFVPAGRALVTGEFGVDFAAGGELEEITRARRVVDVAVLRRRLSDLRGRWRESNVGKTYHPPLVESHVIQRNLGPVVVREGFVRHVETVHGLVPEGYMRS